MSSAVHWLGQLPLSHHCGFETLAHLQGNNPNSQCQCCRLQQSRSDVNERFWLRTQFEEIPRPRKRREAPLNRRFLGVVPTEGERVRVRENQRERWQTTTRVTEAAFNGFNLELRPQGKKGKRECIIFTSMRNTGYMRNYQWGMIAAVMRLMLVKWQHANSVYLWRRDK